MNSSLNKVVNKDMEDNEKDLDREIGMCRTIMKMYGLWIYEKSNPWIETLCNIQTSAIFAYLVILCNIPCISALIKVRGNLILMLDNFMVTMPLICINIKLITLWIKKRVRTETNITDIPGYLLAMQTSYFYDITKGHRYILTKLSQLIYCIMGGLCNTFPDGMFGVLVLHTNAQLIIISKRLKITVMASEMDFHAFRSLVLKHYEIIRFIAVIEDIFNLLILSLVFFFTLVFTILAFQLVTAFTNDTKMPLFQTSFYLMYVMYFMFLMFIYSWVGQSLINHSENLNFVLYDCDWYSLPSNQSLQLMLILLRSQKSLVITIGKMTPVRLESFLQLMKTCAGYVSFLIAIKN
ncbi:uncharacterized protein [Chelonus insularis]|uniref:uncharacterized protein n=1 Tax=Chelonus insularis TaxID=460826 RepID=UPI00158AEC17|nr:uncharacterized protein LOC118065545 [Chelonus insularis]